MKSVLLIFFLAIIPYTVFAFAENDYPKILAKIEKVETKITIAENLIQARMSNITLDNCSGDICYLDNLEISTDNAHLDCSNKTLQPLNNATVGITISGDLVSIINCTFAGFTQAIIISGSENIIAHNIIQNNPEGGVTITGDKNKIFNNTFSDNKKYNIFTDIGADYNYIYNNTMIDIDNLYQPYTGAIGAIGISSAHNKIIKNTITNNAEEGIKIFLLEAAEAAPFKNLIAENTVMNSGVLGLEISGELAQSKKGQNTAFNNIFSQSENEFGLRIRYSHGNRLIGNQIKNNNWQGIHILLANNTFIKDNTVSKNGSDGIWLGDAHKSWVYRNTVKNNHNTCGINFAKWKGNKSKNNIAKLNTLKDNGGLHNNSQICDEDANKIVENIFK